MLLAVGCFAFDELYNDIWRNFQCIYFTYYPKGHLKIYESALCTFFDSHLIYCWNIIQSYISSIFLLHVLCILGRCKRKSMKLELLAYNLQSQKSKPNVECIGASLSSNCIQLAWNSELPMLHVLDMQRGMSSTDT